jgi:hypothetical protein
LAMRRNNQQFDHNKTTCRLKRHKTIEKLLIMKRRRGTLPVGIF